MAPKPRPPFERFSEKVSLEDSGCMIWSAALSTEGYGRFWPGSRVGTRLAHRWAYEHLVGPIPTGLHLDHLCRNRACVNPDHLEPVTNRENLLRGVGLNATNAAKTHCPAGHAYDDENTYVSRAGSRACLTCRRARSQAWRSANLTHARELECRAHQRRRDSRKA